MSKTLECSSAGDKRFSAFYAVLKDENGKSISTIENLYQSCKYKASGQHCRKGEHVDYVIINNKRYEPAILTAYYRYLWYVYLKQNPDLVEYASQFDSFTDKFRGRAINCQADCVKAFVNKDQQFYNCIRPFLKTKNKNN